MTTIGPFLPDAATNDATVGSTAWYDPANVKADDGTSAVFTGQSGFAISNYLLATDFNIDSDVFGASVDSITVAIKADNTFELVDEYSIRLFHEGSPIGDDKSTGAAIGTGTLSYTWTSEEIGALTGTDLLDSSFGVGLAVKNPSASPLFPGDYLSVNVIRITEIQYTLEDDETIRCGFVLANNSGPRTTSSYTWSFTVSGANDTFLSMDVHLWGDATVTALTFNAQALTLIGARSFAGNTMRIESWGLVAPDVGTHTVAVTLSDTVNSVTTGTLYQGVHQVHPTEAFNSATGTNPGIAADAEVEITTLTNDCNIHAACVTDDTSVVANQTIRNNVSTADGSAVQSDLDDNVAPDTYTMSFS